MNKKKIIGDLEIFRHKKIEYLLDNNFWPLSKKEFNKFGKDFFEFFYKIISVQNKEMQNYGIVFVQYVLYFLIHVQIRYGVNFAKDNNYEYIANKKNQKIDFQFVESNFSKKKFSHILIMKIKSIIKFYYYNYKIHGIFFLKYLFKEKYIFLGSYSYLSASLLKKEKKLAKFYYSDYYLRYHFNNNLNKKNQNIIDKANKVYIDPLLKKIKSIDKLYTKSEDILNLQIIFKKKLNSIINFYIFLKEMNIKKKKFIINQPTNIHHKIISFAFDSNNEINIIHHGHDYCFIDNKIGYILNYGNAKKVLVDDSIMAKNYSLYFNENFNQLGKTFFLNLFNKDNFYNLDNNIKAVNNNQNKKVLLVGYPMSIKRGIYEGYLWFHSQIILEYNLLSIFKKNNLYVAYKAHPDRLEELGNIFENHCDKIITNKFENEYHKYDYIIFTYPSTTCFGFTLNTNKKIILLDQGVQWIDKNMSMLKERVKIIKLIDSYDIDSYPAKELINFINQN